MRRGTGIPEKMMEVGIEAYGSPEVLRARDVPVPVPGANELLVRVEAAGVNWPDVMQRQGQYPMPPGASTTPGLEIAGEIVAVGSGVTEYPLGTKTCGLTNGGGYAEYCLLPVGQSLPIPDGMGSIQAAAIPETFFTVWANLFQTGRVGEGDHVLIHGGTSGIGTTALMLLREFGMHAIATAGNDKKCEAIRQLGAEAINYKEVDFVDAVLEQTNGRGVDAILDIVGGSYFGRNLGALADHGTLLLIGFLGGAIAAEVDLLSIALKRVVITGSTMRSRTAEEKAKIANELRNEVWPLLSAGRISPIIHEVFPLGKVADAHRMMEGGAHIGKIVLEVSK